MLGLYCVHAWPGWAAHALSMCISRSLWLQPSKVPDNTGSIPSVPEIFSEEIMMDVAEVKQLCCLEESGWKMLIEPI